MLLQFLLFILFGQDYLRVLLFPNINSMMFTCLLTRTGHICYECALTLHL